MRGSLLGVACAPGNLLGEPVGCRGLLGAGRVGGQERLLPSSTIGPAPDESIDGEGGVDARTWGATRLNCRRRRRPRTDRHGWLLGTRCRVGQRRVRGSVAPGFGRDWTCLPAPSPRPGLPL